MKKALKFLGLAIIFLFLLAIIGGFIINQKGIPSYDVEPIKYQLKSTPESIIRGEKLTGMLCATCHLNRQTNNLVGKPMQDAPPEFGSVYAPNITQDKTNGIGNWTDGELLYLLRTGIKKNGQYAPPYMPKLPLMADEDVNAIISFLRSDHPLVAPDPSQDTPSQASFLTKMLCNVAWKPFPLPRETIEMPDTLNSIHLGKYLAQNLDCFSCHSADFKTNNFLEPEKSISYFGGGNKPLDLNGRVVLTSNLTPDKNTGIGNWTKDKFVQALKYGFKEGEAALRYPMLPYTQLTDKEAGAIYDYLKTIPPIENKIEREFYD